MLARRALDALRANIAVLDRHGVIVAVNDAWTRFARDNGGDAKGYVGHDYLAICERALARGDDCELRETVDKLRGLLNGDVEELSAEYPCDSPTERRWFVLRATRLHGKTAGVVVAHEDITERRRIEQTLRETERTLRSVLEALPVGVWIMDATGRIVHGNAAGVRIWGGARYVGPEEFGEYKGWWLSTGKRIAADEWAAARAIRNGETSIGEEIEIECFDGTRRIILNSGVPLFDEGGAIQGAIIVNQDISAEKAVSRELAEALARERELARIDGLTGAVNRRHFFELATRQIAVETRYCQPLSLILFDVDDFKRINDTHGHQAGDEILRRIASLCRAHLRDADVLARYGGDEFVILLPHTRAADAAAVAERMRADVAAESGATISTGVAELQPPDDTVDAIIHRADRALYDAKKGGRNRTAVFL